MKALLLNRGGSIDGFDLGEKEMPAYGPDELLVKVYAVSMNPSDVKTAEFMQGDNLGIVLGLDVAGEVAGIGENVSGFEIGDRVVYMRDILNPHGGYAEYAVSPAKFVAKIPADMDFVHAAVLPGAGGTAYHIMYHRFHIRKGRTILIQGGAGALGSYTIQMAKNEGLTVITTCLEKDFDYVKGLGADYAIDFTKEDVYARVNEITANKGVHYAISTVNKDMATKDLAIIRTGGELVVTSDLPDFSGWVFYQRGITVHEIAFSMFYTADDEDMNRIPMEITDALADMLLSGTIKYPKITTIPLESVTEYFKKIKAGEITGKVIVEI